MEKDKLSDVGDEELPLVRSRRGRGGGGGGGGGGMKQLNAFSLSHYLADSTSGYNRLHGSSAGADLPMAMQQLNHKHVGAYILALQVIAASLTMCGVSILMPFVLPAEGKSALRNMVCSALTGIALLAKPLLTQTDGAVHPNHQTAPPLRHIFKSMRNAVGFILLAWVVEGLMDSSCVLHDHTIGVLRHSTMVIAFCFIFAASWWRAFYPQSESDIAPTVSLVCLVALVCLPQTQDWTGNPLSKQLDSASGGIRACRVLLFAIAYAGTVLAATPINVFCVDPLVLSVRAFAACSWILVCPPPILFAVPPFCTWLCLRRVSTGTVDGTESVASMTDDGEGDSEAPTILQGVYTRTMDVHDVAYMDTECNSVQFKSDAAVSGLSEDRKKFLLSKLGAR